MGRRMYGEKEGLWDIPKGYRLIYQTKKNTVFFVGNKSLFDSFKYFQSFVLGYGTSSFYLYFFNSSFIRA